MSEAPHANLRPPRGPSLRHPPKGGAAMTLLLPQHDDELVVGSGIDPTVIARRGYRSITADEARALGFAPYQARAGLFLPTWTLAGVQRGGLLKPDAPRWRDGKPVKYEQMQDGQSLLDIHPDARPL